MQLTRQATIKTLKLIGVIALVAIILGYAVWRSLNYVKGPTIDVFEPENGASIASETVSLKGRAERVVSLSLNGKSISIDEQGNFVETIIVFPGVNEITFEAADQFGRKTTKYLTLFGNAWYDTATPAN